MSNFCPCCGSDVKGLDHCSDCGWDRPQAPETDVYEMEGLYYRHLISIHKRLSDESQPLKGDDRRDLHQLLRLVIERIYPRR